MKSCATQIFANQKTARRDPGGHPAHSVADGQPAEVGLAFLAQQETLSHARPKSLPAYAAYTDYEIGRVIQEVEDMGKLDNTLIIYICGDNGTSAEGTLTGTFNQLTAYNGILNAPGSIADCCIYEDWGSDKTYPHMSVGWSLGV